MVNSLYLITFNKKGKQINDFYFSYIFFSVEVKKFLNIVYKI